MDPRTAPLPPGNARPLGARAELPFLPQLSRGVPQPLHRQLAAQLRAAIRDGRLASGSALPSTRALAAQLGVTRTIVTEAYAELDAEGYLSARHGSGTRVARGTSLAASPTGTSSAAGARWLRAAQAAAVDDPAAAHITDLRPGQPSVRHLDQGAWRRAWRAVADAPVPGHYGDPAGEATLRGALAAFVTRSRGLPARAEDLLVTGGTVQAIDLLARAVLRPGDRVAVEEPGYRLARQVFAERGAHILPVAVDGDGLCVDALPSGRGAPLLVYCTPSHQYPLGSRLSASRRLALLAWARREGALIVEDDYDGEFRFHAPPLPPLAALDPACVVYLGTLSKVLTPALRLGYVLAPPELRSRLAREKSLTDAHTSWPVQRALTAYIEGGDLERHIRRMRRLYARQRQALEAALQPARALARLGGIEAGLHACLELAPFLDAEEVARRARTRGVWLNTLSSYYHGPVTRQGVLIGYGALTPEELRRGVGILVEVLRDVASGAR